MPALLLLYKINLKNLFSLSFFRHIFSSKQMLFSSFVISCSTFAVFKQYRFFVFTFYWF